MVTSYLDAWAKGSGGGAWGKSGSDLPPTLDADGLRVRYLVRAVVDIAFRADADVERLIVVT